VILGAAGTATAAALEMLAQAPQGLLSASQPAILDNERLRIVCLLGALGGGVLNLGLFPAAQPGIRPMAWRYTSSVLCGVVLTPIIVHWFGIYPNFDNLAAVSFLMAIIGVGLIFKAVPSISNLILNKLGIATAPDGCAPVPPAPMPVNPPPDTLKAQQTPTPTIGVVTQPKQP
ncbi:MAG TPA: hypothetical protein VGJ21_01705, partial [Terracidiphilus sp.]|jgi:hypothetical protein